MIIHFKDALPLPIFAKDVDVTTWMMAAFYFHLKDVLICFGGNRHYTGFILMFN